LNTSHQRVIAAGRAYVHLIEAADALLGYRPAWTEALLLRLVWALYRRRLRSLVVALPAEAGAEIWAASEKIGGAGAGVWEELGAGGKVHRPSGGEWRRQEGRAWHR
jgi:hypothetical protein